MGVQIQRTGLAISLGVFAIMFLSGCASQMVEQGAVVDGSSKKNKVATPVNANSGNFEDRIGSALTSPLSDLNLQRTELPEILLQAKQAPYAVPKEADCRWLKSEVAALDDVLGYDIDAISVDANGNIIDKGGAELGNATVNSLRSFTEGFVPFRSWVRRLTGAESHAKEVAAAGVAGLIRRSFLKGLAHSKSCPIEPVRIVPEKRP